ncbi:MAG TPA: hypothetical protein DCX49_07440 [Flavobacteriales bacterium]|nr:hypothetical protein [Flavobacteriales bacterium]
MKGRLIPWLVGTMCVAMLVVVAVQVSWLESSAELRKEAFDQSVEQSLQLVATWLSAGHLDRADEDPNVLRTNELGALERRIVRRMEALPMDSLLMLALAEQGIAAEPVYGAFDRYSQPVFLPESSEAFQEDLLTRGYSVAIANLQFRIQFPNLGRYLLGQMLGAFALSVVMMLLIAGIFGYTLYAIQRTKRLDKLQRDLVNNLTHELKTPISSIGLASEAILDPGFDDEAKKHYLHLIREENKRLGVLVENVLRASLSESGAMRLYVQSLNLHDLIKGVVKNMAMQFHKQGAKVELELNASNPNLVGDKIHLTNILFNVIDNAMKYAKEDPHVVIRTTQTPDGLSLDIQDNGVGIAREHLGKVFERLYRVPTGNVHDVKGFGLGLSYVKNVIERHGGTVNLTSRLGEGTTFTFTLPFESQPTTTDTA